MVHIFRDRSLQHNLTVWLIAVAVMILAFVLGQRASLLWLELLAVGAGGLVLLAWPVSGLFALVLAALVLPLEIGTGSEVRLNPASLLVPILTGLWLLDRVRRRYLTFAPSAVNRPLLLFLVAGLLSLLVGRATWDPTVPVGGNFLLVQLAQWSIFAFSALAFWLTANLILDETWLWRLTTIFLLAGGGVAVMRVVPGLQGITGRFTTIAFIRAPLWTLLTAVAAGQLLFNRSLTPFMRGFLGVILVAVFIYAFREQQEAASNWVGVGAVLGTLIWLRYPRLRGPIIVGFLGMAMVGILIPTIWQFAGGDAEWNLSGGSRITLIRRVVEVTLRNPITGLGPAAYRPYANMEPLFYLGAYWVAPLINSHNNWVDLFAHVGFLGLGIFIWFCWEVARLGMRLHGRFRDGFLAGYVNGMLALGAASLVLMLLADWILPFVYNIGFPGFQASVLVWLFLGGLVAIDNLKGVPETDPSKPA